MKYNCPKIIVIMILLGLIFSYAGFAQADPVSTAIEDRIDEIWTTGRLNIGYASIASKRILPGLYERNDYQAIWKNPKNVHDLLSELGKIEEDGLNPEDYHLSTLLVLKLQLDEGDSLDPSILADYDILLTDSLIRLVYHLYFGKVNPEGLHPNWNMTRKLNSKDPVAGIEKTLQSAELAEAFKNLRPKTESYNLLRSALKKYRGIQEAGGWEAIPEGPTLKPGMTDKRVAQLRKRLRVTGDFEGPDTDSDQFDEELKNAVMRFQYRHRLDADGAVGKNTLKTLNVPVKKKINQIRVNLERSRWVLRNLPPEIIVVDIAGFRVYRLQNNKIEWYSKAQVGKPFRNTPVFNSEIKYLVFNPTWTVPPTILRKDILPKIKKNPGYLLKMKISVIDRKGRVVNPNSIDWSKYSGKNVPYTFRQEPGPHNALGRIKFIFPNKHFIYLHDTPSRSLYGRKDRAFSSGCIRVEKNIELAEILLNDPEKWNRESIQKIIDTNKTQRVNLPKPIPVVLLYWTTVFDDKGIIIFKNDVYERDQAVLEGLNEEFINWQRQFFN